MMIKTITALGIISASVLYSVICLITFNTLWGYNLHHGILFPLPHPFFVLFYSFGVYINAAIFRLFLKRERELVPLILAFAAFMSYIVSIIVSSMIVDYTPRVGGESVRNGLRTWGIFLLMQIVVLNAVSYLKNKENIKNFGKKIVIALLINFILFMVGLAIFYSD